MSGKRLQVRANPCYGADGPRGGVVLSDAAGTVTLWLTPAAVATLRRWLARGATTARDLAEPGLRAGNARWWYEPRWARPPRDDDERAYKSMCEPGSFTIELGPRNRFLGGTRVHLHIGAERLARVIDRALAEGRRGYGKRGRRSPGPTGNA